MTNVVAEVTMVTMITNNLMAAMVILITMVKETTSYHQ